MFIRIVLEGQALTEELQKAREILERTDIKTMSMLIVDLMSTIGKFAETIGRLEKDYSEAFVAFKTIGQSPQLLDILVSKAPPDTIGIFIKLIIRLTVIQSKLSKLMELPADEKIKLGKDLIQISEDFRELVK